MAEAYKVLSQGEVATSATALYTVPVATEAIIKHMDVVCTSAAKLKLWVGGTGDGNVILPEVSLATGEFAQWDGTIALEAGQIIYGDSDVSTAITVTIYGLEIT